MEWRDKGKLEKLYIEQELNTYEIGDKLDCSSETVRRWLEKFDIKRRANYTKRDNSGRNSPCFVEYARFEWSQGYPVWRSRADDRALVSVHRLAAVAWFGFDAVENYDVHHKNGFKHDTREENIELIDPKEHRSKHAKARNRVEGRFD